MEDVSGPVVSLSLTVGVEMDGPRRLIVLRKYKEWETEVEKWLGHKPEDVKNRVFPRLSLSNNNAAAAHLLELDQALLAYNNHKLSNEAERGVLLTNDFQSVVGGSRNSNLLTSYSKALFMLVEMNEVQAVTRSRQGSAVRRAMCGTEESLAG